MGLVTPAGPERFEVRIVLSDGREQRVSAEPGISAWDLARKLPIYLNPPCADRRCGGCVVIGDSGLSPIDAAERAAHADNAVGRALRAGERLGCHARVVGPAQLALHVAWTLEDLPELRD